ncbi:unnamed protein product, partial [Nesidiocoris tenuis]
MFSIKEIEGKAEARDHHQFCTINIPSHLEREDTPFSNSTSAMTCIRNLNPSLSSAGQALDSIGYRMRRPNRLYWTRQSVRVPWFHSGHNISRTEQASNSRKRLHLWTFFSAFFFRRHIERTSVRNHAHHNLSFAGSFRLGWLQTPGSSRYGLCWQLAELSIPQMLNDADQSNFLSSKYASTLELFYRTFPTSRRTYESHPHRGFRVSLQTPQFPRRPVEVFREKLRVNWRFYLKSFLGSSYTPCRNRSSPRRIEPWAAHASDIYGPQLSTTAKFDCQLGRIRSKLWSSQGVHLYVTPLQPLQHQIPLTFRTCDETLILLRPSRFAT